MAAAKSKKQTVAYSISGENLSVRKRERLCFDAGICSYSGWMRERNPAPSLANVGMLGALPAAVSSTYHGALSVVLKQPRSGAVQFA